MSCTNCNTDCTCTSDTDACAEQACGCAFEVSAGCIRLDSVEYECIGTTKGETAEQAFSKINDILCNLSTSTDGIDGDSAYQIWLNLGNTGTEQDFLDSLGGTDGVDGTSINHTSFTSSSLGGVAGQQGATDTYTVWADLGETISLGTFTTYNSTDGNDGIDGQTVDHVIFSSSSLGGVAGQAGASDTYTVWGDVGETINLGTFLVYNGSNGVDNYNNVAWVDLTYGNNTSAIVGNIGLPFLTIAAATTASVSGQTIILRPGSYTEDIVLKDGVDIHAQTGVVLDGFIRDNGATVKCNITGNLELSYSLGNTIYSSGINSDIRIELDTITSQKTTIISDPGTGNSNKLHISCNKIIGLTQDYIVTARGDSDVKLIVRDRIETAITTNAISIIESRNFGGVLSINCPKIIIGDSTNIAGGVLFLEDTTNTTGAIYNINVEDVKSNYTNSTPDVRGAIAKNGQGTLHLSIGRINSGTRGTLSISGNGAGANYITMKAVSENKPVIQHAGTQTLVLDNCSLHRRNGGVDDNEVIVIGNASSYPSITNGVMDGINLEIINTQIVKTSSGSDVTGALVAKQGATTKLMIKDCDIIGLGTFTGFACTTDLVTTTEPDIYFRNATSNLANHANVNELGAGMTASDTALTTFNII